MQQFYYPFLHNFKIELFVKTFITDNHLFQNSIEETDHIDQNNGYNEVKKTTKQQQFCGDCGLFFHSKSGYKRHIEIIHAGNKPYKCSYCSLKFYEKRDLKLHFFRKHSAGNFEICICVNLISFQSRLALRSSKKSPGQETGDV